MELNGRAAARVSTASGELVDVPPGGRLAVSYTHLTLPTILRV